MSFIWSSYFIMLILGVLSEMLENPAWLFAFATIIACFGISIAFKQLMSHMLELVKEENSQLLQRVTTGFFIKVALIEAIPIMLLVFGIMKMNKFNGTMDDMIVPLVVTVAVYIFSLLVIFLSAKQVQNYPGLSANLKNQTSVFMMMGIAICSTFPLIAFIMIYLSA